MTATAVQQEVVQPTLEDRIRGFFRNPIESTKEGMKKHPYITAGLLTPTVVSLGVGAMYLAGLPLAQHIVANRFWYGLGLAGTEASIIALDRKREGPDIGERIGYEPGWLAVSAADTYRTVYAPELSMYAWEALKYVGGAAWAGIGYLAAAVL